MVSLLHLSISCISFIHFPFIFIRISFVPLRSFCKIYRFVNAVEALGGADSLAENVAQKNVSSWNDPIGALNVGIQQLGLSGWKPEECKAVGNELLSWKERGLSETEGILLSFNDLSYVQS